MTVKCDVCGAEVEEAAAIGWDWVRRDARRGKKTAVLCHECLKKEEVLRAPS